MCAPCHDDWYAVSRNPSCRRRTVLDGCCGAGGASRGYVDAGFEVWGVDSNSELEHDYLLSGASRFICADILELLADTAFVNQFDFTHVSPPCQRYSQMSRCRPGLKDDYPDLIGPVRDRLEKLRRPWLIENVAAARPWLQDPITLCGTMFNRPVYRHRLFEPGGGITLTAPTSDTELRRNGQCGWHHPVAAAKAGHWKPGMYVSVSGHERKEPVRLAMEIDWVHDRDHVAEAIPPYMTHEIGKQVLAQLLYSRRRHTRVAKQTAPTRLPCPDPPGPDRRAIPFLPAPCRQAAPHHSFTYRQNCPAPAFPSLADDPAPPQSSRPDKPA
jgi:DNA (cytosine-5)-methyltransferase 1